MAKIFGCKISTCLGLLFGQREVLLTAEQQSGVGPKLTNISGGVKHGHLLEGGPTKAKIQYGVKLDIFLKTYYRMIKQKDDYNVQLLFELQIPKNYECQ